MSYVALGALLKLIAGAAVLAIAYPAALCLTGQRRELAQFITSLRGSAVVPAIAK
jgi:hypothetical protein